MEEWNTPFISQACIWSQNNIEKLLKIALYPKTAPSMLIVVKTHYENMPWDAESYLSPSLTTSHAKIQKKDMRKN